MTRYVLAVSQHPRHEGLAVSLHDALEVHVAPIVMATLNRTSSDYQVLGIVPLKDKEHGERVIDSLEGHAVPSVALHYRVTLREVRRLANPSLMARLLGRFRRSRSAGADEEISEDVKRKMAYDVWAYQKISRARLPFVLMGLMIAPVVAISPWYLFYVGNVDGTGVFWHSVTSLLIGVATFYAVAFSAARPVVEEMRQALKEEAAFSR